MLPTAQIGEACEVAQRLCENFARTEVRWQQSLLRNTISIGVAQIALPRETLQAALQRADAALYQAKHEGRGRVVAAPPPDA